MMIADDDDGQFPEVNETHPKLGTLPEPQHKLFYISFYSGPLCPGGLYGKQTCQYTRFLVISSGKQASKHLDVRGIQSE